MSHTFDDFDLVKLQPYWEWNHQPRPDKWSLRERPGYLRLYACQPIVKDDFFTVCNTLTHRALRTADCPARVKIEMDGITDGQEAGLCHFARDTALQYDGIKTLKYNCSGTVLLGPSFAGSTVWFQSIWNLEGVHRFDTAKTASILLPLEAFISSIGDTTEGTESRFIAITVEVLPGISM